MQFEPEYFEGEERSGFYVEPMMKRAWSAILEVYEVIRDICVKNNIHFYACGGTLLGAIRHKGFIPWDDDMDICMLRDEYKRFIEIAPSALPKGFVLAGMYAKDKRLWMANQTMQARVIADEEYFSLPAYMNRFHGYPYPRIGIDIFPYDMMDENFRHIHNYHQIYYFSHYIMRNWYALKDAGNLRKMLRELEKNTASHINTDDDELARQQVALIGDGYGTDTDRANAVYAGNITGCSYPDGFPSLETYTEHIKARIPIEWFGDGVELPFENTTMRVGNEYIKIVERIFGSGYMTPVKFTAGHDYPFYKNQETEFRRMLDESGITVSTDEFCKNWHLANGGK